MEKYIIEIASGMIFLRYLLFAGGAFLLFYILKRYQWQDRKILRRFPDRQQIRRELFFSLLSIAIFIVIFIGVYTLSTMGYTQIYRKIDAHGLFYFLVSIPFLFVFHDTYFYWTHRLLHSKRFSRFHKIHHLSNNPNPLTSFSFHPVEALVQAGVMLIVFIVPIHLAAFSILMFGQMALNVVGHLGYELVPPRFHHSALGRWFNTGTHHHQHHHSGHSNYGLYFNFWDRLMSTNHSKYEEKYRESAIKMFHPKTK